MDHRDLLLVVTTAPYADDTVSTVLRLVEAVLALGASARIWTCGYATMLTSTALGETKPRDVLDWSVRHPSLAAVARGLLDSAPGRLDWETCLFCCQDRGALTHIEGVRMRSPARLPLRVAASGQTIYLPGA